MQQTITIVLSLNLCSQRRTFILHILSSCYSSAPLGAAATHFCDWLVSTKWLRLEFVFEAKGNPPLLLLHFFVVSIF